MDASCWEYWPAYVSILRYSDWLRAGRSGDRIPVGVRFSAPVHTGPEAHPSSCTMGTGSFPGLKIGRGVTLTPHPILVPWSWKGRAIPLLPLWAARSVQSLSACTRVHFIYPWTRSDGIHVDREMRGTFSKLWAISWTVGIALYLLITVDGWRGTLKYSKWAVLETEERGPLYKSSESVLGAMIFIESEVSTPCALVLCFPFLGHILRNADPSSSEERRVFRNLSSVSFLPRSL